MCVCVCIYVCVCVYVYVVCAYMCMCNLISHLLPRATLIPVFTLAGFSFVSNDIYVYAFNLLDGEISLVIIGITEVNAAQQRAGRQAAWPSLV